MTSEKFKLKQDATQTSFPTILTSVAETSVMKEEAVGKVGSNQQHMTAIVAWLVISICCKRVVSLQ